MGKGLELGDLVFKYEINWDVVVLGKFYIFLELFWGLDEMCIFL